MGKIVIELTNRCNLSCRHCFTGRHGGKDDLPDAALDRILDEARAQGFDHLSFTGGDPTVHRSFLDVVRRTSEAGYRFSFVTNGWNFTTVFPTLKPYRDQMTGITFSLDGATEATHDELRGKGSYRRVMQAISVCIVERMPFTINMVLTGHNRHEIEVMATSAERLGADGLRLCHLMPAPLTTDRGFDLSPEQRRQAEAEIAAVAGQHSMPIAMAPGHHTEDLFPCGPLRMEEINVDCHGNLTKCCHLSGHGDGVGAGDVIGNLADISFGEALRALREENETFRRRKLAHRQSDDWRDDDHFPCWYCSLYYKKVDWLESYEDNPWARSLAATPGGRVTGSDR